MFQKIVTKLTIFALQRIRLSGEQKALVTSALLDNLGAFPIKDIIDHDENSQITINGRRLDIEQAVALRDSAIALKGSYFRKVISDQMKYEAIKLGILRGENQDMICFSKAVLWVLEQEEKLLSTFVDEV